jgi:uncharacterized coiled-coil protein SlyX
MADEPITLDYLGRMFTRFSDDLADLKSQFIVQTAILQRLDVSVTTLATEVREVRGQLDRMNRRLRALEEREPARAK